MPEGSDRDQASTLRKLMQERASLAEARACSGDRRPTRAEARALPAARVMTIASGKGGVGKTSLAANIGTLLARSGARVMLVDGDFGLANLDILLGAQPTATVEEILDGRASLQDALVGIEPNLWLVPASSGVLSVRQDDRQSQQARERLMTLFEACPWEMDLILLDLGAGIQDNVLKLHSPLYDSVVVITPEPTSLTDGYGLLKLLQRHSGVTRAEIIVNQVTHAQEARLTFKKFKDVVDRFLDIELGYAGHCEYDENFTRAVMNRKILLDLNREARALPALELLSRHFRSRIIGIGERDGNVAVPRDQCGISLTRFQDEPGQGVPGNTARFWRALLGEVKA